MEKLIAWCLFLTIFSLFAADVYATQTNTGVFESLYAFATEEKTESVHQKLYEVKPLDCKEVAAALLNNEEIPQESKRMVAGVNSVLGATAAEKGLEAIDTYMAYTECFDYLY